MTKSPKAEKKELETILKELKGVVRQYHAFTEKILAIVGYVDDDELIYGLKDGAAESEESILARLWEKRQKRIDEQNREALAEAARAKLTPAERRALGLETNAPASIQI